MSHTSPEDGHGWPTTTSGPPSPRDGVPTGGGPEAAPPASNRALLLAAVGGVAALVVVALVMVVNAGGEDDGGEEASQGNGIGGAVATATTGAPSNSGTVAPTTTPEDAGEDEDDGESGGEGAGADLPAVTIPTEASPPSTIPGSEPNSLPTDIMSGAEAPQWGTIVVDLEESGYEDFPVHLRTDQELSLLSLADDGIETAIEVFAPDGSSEGSWEGGEPEVINGLEWYLPDEPLPATGVYVIRVIHTGGSHEPFVLGFFGNE